MIRSHAPPEVVTDALTPAYALTKSTSLTKEEFRDKHAAVKHQIQSVQCLYDALTRHVQVKAPSIQGYSTLFRPFGPHSVFTAP